ITAMFSDKRDGLTVANIELKSGDFAQLKMIYSQYPREGDLSIHLLNETGDEIYLMSFSFGEQGQLYVCSLQGPSTEQSVEQVKSITKQMHAMRPKNLLMSAIYAVAAYFQIKSILGISNNSHIKSQHLKSSYDTFWEECGGVLNAEGWYQLPLQEPMRDIESVKSQRRSEFRKREALREAMSQNIIESLTQYSNSAQK
ncbi:MAG: VirK/YbjX family protein, partial [Providencia alcalifaciens]|nr:VirK/YbjX family protein [Providencia alcalifaciens]